ncbi:MAG: hypothetical protein LUE86_14080 [Clostridiales bacterium]|nr:hypothetical protein [Clostridiales bacterium]
MTEHTRNRIDGRYNEMYEGYDVPKEIRRRASLILFRFGIYGLCDGMYISNTIGVCTSLGNGTGEFRTDRPIDEEIRNRAEFTAREIQDAYYSCIPSEDLPELVDILANATLDNEKALRGMQSMINANTAEINRTDEAWRESYLTKRNDILASHMIILTQEQLLDVLTGREEIV